MSLYGLIRKSSWLVIALACVGVGLKTMGVDLEALLHLQSMDVALRYLVGICGLGSLVGLIVMPSMGCDCSCSK